MPQFTLDDATRASCAFKSCPHILGVEVFGSIATFGMGNDIDLILLCSDSHAQVFIAKVKDATAGILPELPEEQLYGRFCPPLTLPWMRRQRLIREILGETFTPSLKAASAQVHQPALDLVLFPSHWQERVGEICAWQGAQDMQLLGHLAREAKRLV